MKGDAASIAQLLESVADGQPVDWSNLEAQADDEQAKRLLQHLRVIASVAEVHRSHADDEGVQTAATETWHPAAGRIVGRIGPDSPLARFIERRPETPPLPLPSRWGQLELLERVGAGAFGEVYRARDLQLDREVAVKLLHRVASQDWLAARILAEARILARIRHPNVVTVYGADDSDGRVGLWMEFVRGRTLEELLATHGKFGAQEAALIGQQICRALAAVHAAGLVHRDVKAQNVMREEGGRLVLMDFGTGQLQGQAARTGEGFAGTPLYLAPEILRGEEASVRTDIYSLGVLLYHLVTGSYPLRARSLDELRRLHASGAMLPLHDVRPDLPDGFVRTVERALQPNPDDRYQSAGAMQRSLSAALGLSSGIMRAAEVKRALEQVQARQPAPQIAGGPVAAPAAKAGRTRRFALTTIALTIGAALLAFAFSRTGLSDRLFGTPPALRGIAVLPLEFTGSVPEHWATEMSQGLVNALGAARPLRVTSRTSVLQALSTPRPLPQIGALLGVDGIVEGSVSRDRDRVRLTVRVIHAGTDRLLWSGTFERNVSAIMALPGDAARAIARRFVPEAAAIAERPPRPAPIEAYEYYARGRLEAEAFSVVNLRQAIEYYQQAIRLDRGFAPAYAGLASAYTLLGGSLRGIEPEVAYDRAMDAAQQALRLDETLADAHAAIGFARYYLGWEWKSAESEFRRALDLNPGHALAWDTYANFLTAVGRHNEAIAAIERAAELDPLSPMVLRDVAWHYFFARQYDEAAVRLERTLATHPDYLPALTLLGRVYIQMHRFDEAIDLLTRAYDLEPDGRALARLAHARAAAGQHDEARRILAELTDPRATRRAPPYFLALVYAALGEDDRVLDLLERGVVERDAAMVTVRVDPRLDRVRTNPRFTALVNRAGLVP